jgi:hypothetical protein
MGPARRLVSAQRHPPAKGEHRMKKIRRTIPLMGVACMVAAASALAPRSAASAAAEHTSPVVGHSFSVAEQRATLAYWTPQRQASAKPADIRTAEHGPTSAVPQPPQAVPVGKPGMVSGGPPAHGGPAARARGAGTAPSTASASYLSFNVPTNLYTVYPYDLNGKIFFTFEGQNYACSGTSVASYHGPTLEDEVWTAGHCVVNENRTSPGVYDTNLEFVPGYNGAATTIAGRYPFGVFTATNAETTAAWADNGDLSVDEAAVVVGTNASGQTLGQAVGYDGFIYNQPDSQNFTAFGYPQASPYTGNLMVEDIASTAGLYLPPGASGQASIGIDNPMTQGASGGAWNIDWSTSNPGYIDGHNDYTESSQPGILYSPYQDTLANEVRCFGATSC